MAKPPSNRKKTTSAASPDSTSGASSVNEDISQQVDPGSATITVTAVVFGVVGKAEPFLFDGFGREIVELAGVGNPTRMQQCCK